MLLFQKYQLSACRFFQPFRTYMCDKGTLLTHVLHPPVDTGNPYKHFTEPEKEQKWPNMNPGRGTRDSQPWFLLLGKFSKKLSSFPANVKTWMLSLHGEQAKKTTKSGVFSGSKHQQMMHVLLCWLSMGPKGQKYFTAEFKTSLCVCVCAIQKKISNVS